MNWCLIAKWASKILTGQGGLWLTIFKNKYLTNRGTSLMANQHKSQFANAIGKVQQLLRLGTKFEIGNGGLAKFWGDRWCRVSPLQECYPALHANAQNPQAMVEDYWDDNRWAPAFKRTLGQWERDEWQSLCHDIQDKRVTDRADLVSWRFDPSGTFSMGLLYMEIFRIPLHATSWTYGKQKIPAKIKIFIWQVAWNRIPNGYQVLKRHGPGDGKCIWCGHDVTCGHIIFRCIVARYLWSALEMPRAVIGTRGFCGRSRANSGHFRQRETLSLGGVCGDCLVPMD